MVNFIDQIIENILGTLKTINFMVKVVFIGLMAENIKDNIKKM